MQEFLEVSENFSAFTKSPSETATLLNKIKTYALKSYCNRCNSLWPLYFHLPRAFCDANACLDRVKCLLIGDGVQ